MPQKITQCKNCNHQFEGNFCNQCGQKASVGIINFKDILHEIWHNFTHTDRGYLQLFWDMLARPGITIKNYLSGQRKRYFNPFTYFIVTTSILILITHFVYQREYEVLGLTINDEFGNYIAKNGNYILFAVMPFISVLLWAFFFRSFKSLAEAFVVIIFVFGTINFLFILSNIFFYFFITLHHDNKGYVTALAYVYMLYVFVALLKPLKVFGITKTIVLTLIIYFLVEMIAKGILLLIYGVPIEQLNFS